MNEELGSILKDAAGNFLVDNNGCVTCTSERGFLEFKVNIKDIDFNCDTLQCKVGEKTVFIKLHEDTNIVQNNLLNNTNNDTVIREKSNETFQWTDNSTKLFLSLYKEKKELLKNRKIKTKKVLWEQISEIMQAHGYNVTVIQVENKLKTLERSYKNMILNNKQTGRGRTTCPYETELSELLHHKHSIEPLAVSGRHGVILRKNEEASTSHNQSICDTNEENIRSLSPEANAGSFIDMNKNSVNENVTNEIPTNTVNYHSNQIVVSNKNSNIKMGTTARFLDSCQKTMERLLDDLKKEKDAKTDIQRQILVEFKQMRSSYENYMKEANKFREERNKLLQELISRKDNE